MIFRIGLLAGMSAVLLLAGCVSDRGQSRSQQLRPSATVLLQDDANHDGTITRGELEAGLRTQFAAADTNHDGRLDEDEVRAVNQARWHADASSTSPLVDWNHDGYVDFDEFAAGPRSLFAQLDEDGNGAVTKAEMRPEPAAKPHKKRPHGPLERRRRQGPYGGDSDGDGS